MIIFDLLIAFICGAAANQLDRPIARIESIGWQLVTRYIVGVLAAFVPFSLLMRHLRQDAQRDGYLAYGAAFAFTAIGVITARGLRDLAEATK